MSAAQFLLSSATSRNALVFAQRGLLCIYHSFEQPDDAVGVGVDLDDWLVGGGYGGTILRAIGNGLLAQESGETSFEFPLLLG